MRGASSSRCFNRRRIVAGLIGLAVDKLLAELRDVFANMTLAQRRHLKIIVSLQDAALDEGVVRSLVDVGLVVRLGDTYCATAAGGYISRLY
jgi:hypothetical protein